MLRGAIVAGILLLLIFAYPQARAEQTTVTCKPGEELVDVDELLKENNTKNLIPGTKVCRSAANKDLAADCSVPEPKKYLLARLDGKPAEEVTGMGNVFACNLAKFIDAAQKQNITIRIWSGARKFISGSTNCQRLNCQPSTHEKGCAADISFNGDGINRPKDPNKCTNETIICRNNPGCVWAHDNAVKMGLQFRLMPQSGFGDCPEPWHIELAGARGSDAPADQRCPDVAGAATPGGIQDPSPGASSPMSSIGNAMRNFFSPPPPPIATTAISPTMNPTQYFTPAATSQPSPSGTITISDNPPEAPKAVSELITAIASGDTTAKATTTATGTPIALIDALGNTAGLHPGATPTSTATRTIAVASLTPNDTFVSQDLSKTPVQNVLRGNSTFVILEALRQTLIRLLAIIKPFGGVRNSRPVITSELLE